MSENTESKKNNKYENIIGILLVIPIYMLVYIILCFLKIFFKQIDFDIFVILPWLMYLPIIIGVLISFKKYKEKASKVLIIPLVFFMALALYYFCNTYYIDHPGFENIGYFVYWFISTAVCRIFSYIFFRPIVGKKKAITFFLIYILIIALIFALAYVI